MNVDAVMEGGCASVVVVLSPLIAVILAITIAIFKFTCNLTFVLIFRLVPFLMCRQIPPHQAEIQTRQQSPLVALCGLIPVVREHRLEHLPVAEQVLKNPVNSSPFCPRLSLEHQGTDSD